MQKPRSQPMDALDAAVYRAVVIGASAGGIPALMALLERLPACFPVPVLIVQHLSPRHVSRLAQVLGRKTRLPVIWAEQGDCLRPGTVYVAPPDLHLTVPDEHVHLSSTAPVGHWRPAVDVLFRSAAQVWGRNVIAIVLSGVLYDGAQGMARIAEAGGVTITQDEGSASHFDMPAAALDLGRADVAMNPAQIAQALRVLTRCEDAPPDRSSFW